MTSILYLKTSPRGEASQSTKLGNQLVARLQRIYPGANLIVRDLVAERIPHIEEQFVFGRYLPPEQRTPEQAKAVIPSDGYLADLKPADIVVIASSMINFSISSNLKAWIDQIIRAGHAYAMQDGRPVGLLTDKKVYVIEARGGAYNDPPFNMMDFQRPYLRSVLGFLGMTDITFITAESLSMGDEAANASMMAAQELIESISPS